jgi:voltage-gated potassium channel
MTTPGQTRRRPRLARLLERAMFGQLTPRRAARVIAGVSLLLAVIGGVAVRLLDSKEFHSLGDSLWWAAQTVTTVGYGDVVPEHWSGRLVGIVLMFNGIALISVITAGVTALLIEQLRRQPSERDDEILAKLERLEASIAELKTKGE